MPDSLHNTTTMVPIQQKRKPINRGEVPLLRRAAVIGHLWHSQGNGEDSAGNCRQTLLEVFGLPHRTVTVTDMVKKAKWRTREAIGNREGKEAISEDRITLDDMLNALKDAKRQGRPQANTEG